ncbi:MAG: DUF368 domain-containing protein [Clostridiales bacterium]|nr:DUF368 domain-containing protein [Clostridiales bacterium]
MSDFNSNNVNEASFSGKNSKRKVFSFFMNIIHGIFIGVGAVLPGISGGVLCVVFGVYKPIMELLSHPFKALKKYAAVLAPVIIGMGAGFLGVSKILGFFLEKYPNPSVCFFVGLIAGMLPSLFREAGEKGRSKNSYISMAAAFFIVLILLLGLQYINVNIQPNFAWYVFCGFCIALSVIAPGMSFSTLLMPLGLYTPLVVGIGNFDFGILIPAGVGALLTVILLAKAVTKLMETHYSVVFHAIIGIVIAATVVIIPFESFISGFSSCAVNIVCIAAGIVIALLLDKMNSKVEIPE